MDTTTETFIAHLKQNKEWNFHFEDEKVEGNVNIWMHDDQFILTWQEFPPGEEDSEHLYTKDERHAFNTSAELIEFLENQKLYLAEFEP